MLQFGSTIGKDGVADESWPQTDPQCSKHLGRTAVCAFLMMGRSEQL